MLIHCNNQITHYHTVDLDLGSPRLSHTGSHGSSLHSREESHGTSSSYCHDFTTKESVEVHVQLKILGASALKLMCQATFVGIFAPLRMIKYIYDNQYQVFIIPNHAPWSVNQHPMPQFGP